MFNIRNWVPDEIQFTVIVTSEKKIYFVIKITSGEKSFCCQGYIRGKIILLSRLHQGKYSVSMFKVISVEKIRMVSR